MMSGEDGESTAATKPEMRGGIARARDSTLALSPIISPWAEGGAVREIAPCMFAAEKPLAIARNGTIKRSSHHVSVKNCNKIKILVQRILIRNMFLLSTV